jgi:hypothetical protein
VALVDRCETGAKGLRCKVQGFREAATLTQELFDCGCGDQQFTEV